MNRGCLVLAGLGLISLLAFGVTLEAISDPEQLTAIPFTPRDFLTYSILALAILTLIQVVRKRSPRKALVRKWTSRLAQQGARIRTSLCLASDGSAAAAHHFCYFALSREVDRSLVAKSSILPGSAFTGLLGRTLMIPFTITTSSGCNPDFTTRNPSASDPRVIWRRWATFLESTRWAACLDSAANVARGSS